MLMTILLFAMHAHALLPPPHCAPPSKQLIVTPCAAGEGCSETWSWQEPELGAS